LAETTLHNQQFSAEGGGWVGAWGPPGGLDIGVGKNCSAYPPIGRGFLWQGAGLGYDANDLSLKLEGFRPGACGHGFCLVPVTYKQTNKT